MRPRRWSTRCLVTSDENAARRDPSRVVRSPDETRRRALRKEVASRSRVRARDAQRSAAYVVIP